LAIKTIWVERWKLQMMWWLDSLSTGLNYLFINSQIKSVVELLQGLSI